MPLKLNVSISRKIGEPNYGSRGASCQLELELDVAMLSEDPARFQQRVHEAFGACRQAVQEELARSPTLEPNERRQEDQTAASVPASRAAEAERVPRPATANQVKAIRAIAHRAGIRPGDELFQRYGVGSLEMLTVRQASELIDLLKEQLDARPVAG